MSNNNNVHVLSNEDVEFLNKKYSFAVHDDKLLVSTTTIDRTTCHNINDKIYIHTASKKVQISTEAIKLWNEHFKDKYTLIEIQNAINALIVLSQSPDKEDILKQLKRKSLKVKEV